MTGIDRDALVRHLRQLAELGEREIFFDELTVAEAIALLRGGPDAGSPDTVTAALSGRSGDPATVAAAAARAGSGAASAGSSSSGPASASGLAARLAAALTDAPAPPQPAATDTGAASMSATAHRSAGAAPGTEHVAGPTPDVQHFAMPAHDAARQERIRANLTVLQQEANNCERCTILAEQRRNVVFARGNPITSVMVVGEAPGQEEDRTGLPFVGPAGRLLDLLLLTAGFGRDSVYICNTLKCRPPNNRNPLPEELAACSGFLQGQIEAIAPRVLLAVGKFAAQALLNSEESIGRLRGRVHTYRGIPLVVTYHPAYLLRSSQPSRLAWQDFQLLRQVLDEQA